MSLFNSIGVRKCKGHLQATRGLGYYYSSLLTGLRPISASPPLQEGFYLALVSARLGILFFEDTYRHLVSWLRRFDSSSWKILVLQDLMKIFFLHLISRFGPDAGNPSLFTIPLAVQARWMAQESSTKVHMCYQCFCSTLASMLSKFN